MCELKKQHKKLQQRIKNNPNNSEFKKQIHDVEEQIDNISLYRHEGRLAPYVRVEAIRFLLTVGVNWPEMPPCLVDKRQPWLGKEDRGRAFYTRQETLLRYQGSDTAEEFEERCKAFEETTFGSSLKKKI